MSPFDLTGCLAVVTGASRGIGRSMAIALADAGADIIGVSTRLGSTDDGVGTDVRKKGREFHGYSVDFADRNSVLQFADDLDALDRPVDILVNNAGTIERYPVVDHPLESFDRVLAVNLTNQFVLTQHVGRSMIKRGHGRVLFTASLLSFQGGINVPGYAAAKSGLAGLTRALSNEWAAHGITVNAIAPGYIATDNTKPLYDDQDRGEEILHRIPIGRWGQPSDVAGATVFLASAAAAYITGVVLPVDGGWLSR